MSQTDEEQNIEHLISLLNNQAWRIREEAVKALVKVGEPAVMPLLALLKGGKGNHADAVRILGRIGDRRAVEPLIDALYTKNVHLTQEAVQGLGSIGDSRAVQPLIDMFRHDWDDTETIAVWQKAVTALAAIGKPALQPLLMALKDEDENVRRGATESLGQLRDPRSVDALITVLQDGESVVRVIAVDALAKVGDKRAVEPLVALLKDKDWYIRCRTLYALGELKGPAVYVPLVSGLDDLEPRVRSAAVYGLGKLQNAPIHDHLLTALKDPDARVRSAAILTLSKVGDERALPALFWVEQNDTGYSGVNRVKDHATYAIQRIQERQQKS